MLRVHVISSSEGIALRRAHGSTADPGRWSRSLDTRSWVRYSFNSGRYEGSVRKCEQPRQRRRPDRHAPTIGILVCTYGKDQVIRFALGSAQAPMAVATYTYDTLPAAERAALPSVDEIAAAVIATPTLDGQYADELLERLGAINPHLNHQRSIGRARSTLLDIRQGKDEATLVRNTRMRFSNGTTVDLDDNQATQVLDTIRELYQRAGTGAP